jgi:hypothetical protein
MSHFNRKSSKLGLHWVGIHRRIYEEPRQIGTDENMRDTSDKTIWGMIEKFGKGTLANYNPDVKTITFCFSKNSKTSRELLIKTLQELGYSGYVRNNGEVISENVEKEDVVLVKKNHQLIIHLNKKRPGDKENGVLKESV